ncbi:hypothetical protein [Nitrosomonas aestuarii]|uniref:hypothetical protein n=1 Tax=Nitrosomonas aestuarii TaxID=52441 RepID=UPI001BAB8069|nr:hypothetical protein [Nitrosomonas aestuarii]
MTICLTAVLPGSSIQFPAGCPPEKLSVTADHPERSRGAALTPADIVRDELNEY